MNRNVCVVTGARAEYGLLKWVMHGIKNSDELNLQVIATGMHLSPRFGLTYQKIEEDGFCIDYKVEMLLNSDTSVGISKSIGLGVIGFADAFEQLKPDLLLVLGDRFEILAAVCAAHVARIPIAHLHGGEATEGLIDEGIRHAITKMSHLHFVSNDIYRKRVIQLGEQPGNVFVVGGLGVDSIKKHKLLDRNKLENILKIKFLKKNILITYHPVTLENNTASEQFKELLSALENLNEVGLVFTLPNADAGSHDIAKMIESFTNRHKNSCSFVSMGELYYLSCLQYVDGVVGNSSSGLTEVPSFNKGTVNVGDRQRGRLKATSVIDCEPNKVDIQRALEILFSKKFQDELENTINPYGQEGASEKIIQMISKIELSHLLKKKFYDLPILCE